MTARALLIALSLPLATTFLSTFSPVVQARETLTEGDLILHSDALHSKELTAEAAQLQNVSVADNRGVLTITILKKKSASQAANLPAQIFAGALNRQNYLMNIPIREVRDKNGVFYVGEYSVSPKESLTFLVNVNVQGKPFKAKFSQAFN